MTARSLLAAPIVAALVLSFASAAHAEVGASASIASDYRFEGLSLSDSRPVLSVSLAYDRPSGFYGGATLLAVFARRYGLQPLGYVVYLGYSKRVAPDLSWDIGATDAGVSQLLDKRYADDYAQVYVGVTKGALSAHVYYSPSYIGEHEGAIYLDLSGAVRPAPRWRIFAHAGLLANLGHADPEHGRLRADARAGVARELRNFELRASVSATEPAPFYPTRYRQPNATGVLEAVLFF